MGAPVARGVRVGSATLTSRSVPEEEFKTIAGFLHRAVQLAVVVQKESGVGKIADFHRVATSGKSETVASVKQLKRDIRTFARQFPLPGVDVSKLKKPDGVEED